ncbi:MAG TPA: hypothetical protein VD999_04570 [Vitreimonas sp.]|nr:hypothetical protein [Vitreimonas sp.]
MKLMTATTLAAALTLSMVSLASAQVMEQNQEQRVDNNVRVNCTTGAYGQSSTCTAEAAGSAYGRQYQRMENRQVRRRADGTLVYVHTTANTGMDMYSIVTVLGTVMTGSTAAVLKLKNRVA